MSDKRVVPIYMDEGENWMQVGEAEVEPHPEGARILRAVITNPTVSSNVFDHLAANPLVKKQSDTYSITKEKTGE